MFRRNVLAVLTTALLSGMLLQSSGCGELTGLLGGCEVIYVVRESDRQPDTGIRFINDLSSGLHVLVRGDRIVDAGSNMGPGDCEIYGLFPGDYDVRLRQCTQGNFGSTECTSTFGPEVRRTVTVEAGRITELRVNRSLFP